MVAASVILHNLYETAEDLCLAEWTLDVPSHQLISNAVATTTSSGREDGALIRNAIAQYFCTS